MNKKAYMAPDTISVKVRIQKMIAASQKGLRFSDDGSTGYVEVQDNNATGVAMGRGGGLWDDDDDY